MADGVRWWDIYSLEELGCSERTLDVFEHTHDADGNFYPTIGQWIDHCSLEDLHPFFAGNRMPVTKEGMDQLLLVERDILQRTVRKFGKSWWKGREEDYKLYKEFALNLNQRVSKIPYEVVRQYESKKRGYCTMPHTVVYNPNTSLFLSRMRINWLHAKKEVKGSFFKGFIPKDPSRSSNKVRKYKLRDISSSVYMIDGGVKEKESLLKKSGRPYLRGPAAFLEEIGSHILQLMTGYAISWGKDRLPGFGDDIWQLTHCVDGRPCPNIKEWFDWCKKTNVHPLVKGQDCDFSNPKFHLWFSLYEQSEIYKAASLWKGRSPVTVLEESAAVYDKLMPLPDGKKRQYGQLHITPYLDKRDSLQFPDYSLVLNKDFKEIVNTNLQQRRLGLNRFARQIVRSAGRRASMIIEQDKNYFSMEWNRKPLLRGKRKKGRGL